MQFNIPAEHKNASGVYIIRNTVNSKVYVGSAANLWVRYSRHMWELANDRHHNEKLSRAVAKHGVTLFIFSLLERCPQSCLLQKEQHYIDALDAVSIGYNIAKLATGGGFPCSEENRAKLSAQRKGKPAGAQARLARAENMAAKRLSTEPKICEHCESRFNWKKGVSWGQFLKRRYCSISCSSSSSMAKKGNIPSHALASSEAREKSEATRKQNWLIKHPVRLCITCNKELPTRRNTQKYCDLECFNKQGMSDETRRKLSESSKRNPITPEARARMNETRKARGGYKLSPESQAKRLATIAAKSSCKSTCP